MAVACCGTSCVHSRAACCMYDAATYSYNTVVTLTVSPSDNWQFVYRVPRADIHGMGPHRGGGEGELQCIGMENDRTSQISLAAAVPNVLCLMAQSLQSISYRYLLGTPRTTVIQSK